MIKLTMKEILINARRAFDAGELQMQKGDMGNTGCLYSGPCAIGISVPVEMREKLDNTGYDTSIDYLQTIGLVKIDHIEDAERLQQAHDTGFINLFEKTLKELEAEYDLVS